MIPQPDAGANSKKGVGESFLRLVAMPIFPLDRLNRYEHTLWRQARQIVFTLESLRCRARPSSHSRFPFSFSDDKDVRPVNALASSMNVRRVTLQRLESLESAPGKKNRRPREAANLI